MTDCIPASVQLGNAERVSCMLCPPTEPELPCCIARAFYRAAVDLQEQAAIAATAETSASGAGKGHYAKRHSGASKPYSALGSNELAGPRLVKMLGWWARMEMHLGQVSARTWPQWQALAVNDALMATYSCICHMKACSFGSHLRCHDLALLCCKWAQPPLAVWKCTCCIKECVR